MGSPVSAPVARSVRTAEPLAEALHRLAAKAHAEGVVVIDDLGYAPFACRVSSSREGHEPYVVNLAPGMLHGCDCEGYFRWQRCKHYALCLELAGWLPDVDDIEEGAAQAAPPPRGIAAWGQKDRRALAAADLATRYPSLHPARPEDLAVA